MHEVTRAVPADRAVGLPIRTPRLTLRLAEASDAAPLAVLMTDAISARLSAWPMPWTEKRMAARIAEWRQIGLPCVVERNADGALVGWVHALRGREDPERASMGWWCAEAHRGQGYVREAAKALLPVAFARLGVSVVEAGAQPDNHASFAVMRALGMAPVGVRITHAPARGRNEPTFFHEVRRG
ncbi:GNAT family N-acetyltransferase [Roseomonas chloroacetimidivorans]|jgi:ribosomal-protein-alanine N-acetyltransferase|uniref:GNAT family N-acetyltransferase n=1 Tax=Roseomonas chloroacetimidivorans TaxID=1766656 RepID=UPI003C76ABFC